MKSLFIFLSIFLFSVDAGSGKSIKSGPDGEFEDPYTFPLSSFKKDNEYNKMAFKWFEDYDWSYYRKQQLEHMDIWVNELESKPVNKGPIVGIDTRYFIGGVDGILEFGFDDITGNSDDPSTISKEFTDFDHFRGRLSMINKNITVWGKVILNYQDGNKGDKKKVKEFKAVSTNGPLSYEVRVRGDRNPKMPDYSPRWFKVVFFEKVTPEGDLTFDTSVKCGLMASRAKKEACKKAEKLISEWLTADFEKLVTQHLADAMTQGSHVNRWKDCIDEQDQPVVSRYPGCVKFGETNYY